MATITDRFNPSFVVTQAYTDRTAWRPFGYPVILVVPFALNDDGSINDTGQVKYVKIYIKKSTITPVAGFENKGIFKPDYEIYSIVIDISELRLRKIKDTEKTVIDSGSKFQYYSRAGTVDTYQVIQNAEYFDITDVKLEVGDLEVGRYDIIYETEFYFRTSGKSIDSDINQFLCIDTDNLVKVQKSFLMNHPGEVILSTTNKTPSVYLTDAKQSNDTTVEFYRPFTDIIQDVYDEQNLLRSVNYVYDVRPQYIPYLSNLLGWELPYFPRSIDELRKSTLIKNITRLQKLKGSKRAVRELLDIFGFSTKLYNVWYAPDGTSLIGVNESSGSTAIQIRNELKTDMVTGDLDTETFGQTTVILLKQPSEYPIVINSFIVNKGSDAYDALKIMFDNLSSNINYYDTSVFSLTDSNRTIEQIKSVYNMSGIVGRSTILVNKFSSEYAIDDDGNDIKNGLPIIKPDIIAYRSTENSLEFNFDYFANGDGDTAVFVFANYVYENILLPDNLTDLRSNRFDIQISTKSNQSPQYDAINFLIDFIYRVKAFHSILRKLQVVVEAFEAYEVTDFCFDSIFNEGSDCKSLEESLNNSTTDFLRELVITLTREFQAWAAIQQNCLSNADGQDRVIDDSSLVNQVESTNGLTYSDRDVDSRPTICDGPLPSTYCFKGRVNDIIEHSSLVVVNDFHRIRTCTLLLGQGMYYLYSGTEYTESPNNRYFINPGSSLLGGLYKSYGSSSDYSIHYLNETTLLSTSVSKAYLGMQRFSLEIEKDNLNIPMSRLPTLNKLKNNFISNQYKLRPWDAVVNCGCDILLDNTLNPTISSNGDGTTELSYTDDVPWSVDGNDLNEDIPDFIGQSSYVGDPNDVIHLAYIGQYNDPIGVVSLFNSSSEIGIIEVDKVVFDSASKCGGTSSFLDYSSGYPSSYGYLSGSDTSQEYLFTFSSFLAVHRDDIDYRFYGGFRLDCGCLKVSCGDTSFGSGTDSDGIITGKIESCPMKKFYDLYGNFDPDQIELSSWVGSEDIIYGSMPLELDSENSSVFWVKQRFTTAGYVLDQNGTYGQSYFPPNGSYKYKDDYGIIYEYDWATSGSSLDFSLTIKDPRNYHSSNNPQFRNMLLYVTGIISKYRYVYSIGPNGEYSLVSQGSLVTVEEFLLNDSCNIINPFIHSLGEFIQDTIDFEIISV